MWFVERILRHVFRTVILLVLILSILGITQNYWVTTYGGSFQHQPEEFGKLSESSKQFVSDINKDYRSQTIDYRLPILAFGTDKQHYLNPKYTGWRSPAKRFSFLTLASAAGISNNSLNTLSTNELSKQYEYRLVRQLRLREKPSRAVISALDYFYTADGKIDFAKTSYRTSNQQVLDISQRWPELFLPAVSVHPFRLDALARLKVWHKQGVKYLNIAPSIQGVDPSDSRLEPYWNAVKQLGFTVITTSGHASSSYIHSNNDWGNPWLWEPVLRRGIKVVMQGLGGIGEYSNPYAEGGVQHTYEIFMEMTEKRYGYLLFGDLAGITEKQAIPDMLQVSLQNPNLNKHLVYASNYPFSAQQRALVLDKLAEQLFITADEVTALEEVYQYNPLLMDKLLKTSLRLPQTQGEDAIGFNTSVFAKSFKLPH